MLPGPFPSLLLKQNQANQHHEQCRNPISIHLSGLACALASGLIIWVVRLGVAPAGRVRRRSA